MLPFVVYSLSFLPQIMTDQKEIFTGGVLNSKSVVTVCVYHKRHGKLGLELDEFIGHTHIPLSSLDVCDNKERIRWCSLEGKKKDSKKARGEVEVAFKFLNLNRPGVVPTKKTSSKPLQVIASGVREKLRRKSEDEDSGVGDTERFSPGVLAAGRSYENLYSSSVSDSCSTPVFQRSARTSSVNSSPGSFTSARGSGKLQASNSLAAKRALSVGVLTAAAPAIGSNLNRSNSGAGTHDSGNCSSNNSPEIIHRSSSLTDVSKASESSPTPSRTLALGNRNASNSAGNREKRHSMVDINQLKKQAINPLPTLYKPKNFYRLDVRDLPKVSTIHEDCSAPLHTMTHDDLVKLAAKQQQSLSRKDKHIRELEDYIDDLIVRVMVYTPQILDNAYRAKDDMF